MTRGLGAGTLPGASRVTTIAVATPASARPPAAAVSGARYRCAGTRYDDARAALRGSAARCAASEFERCAGVGQRRPERAARGQRAGVAERVHQRERRCRRCRAARERSRRGCRGWHPRRWRLRRSWACGGTRLPWRTAPAPTRARSPATSTARSGTHRARRARTRRCCAAARRPRGPARSTTSSGIVAMRKPDSLRNSRPPPGAMLIAPASRNRKNSKREQVAVPLQCTGEVRPALPGRHLVVRRVPARATSSASACAGSGCRRSTSGTAGP